MTIIVHQDKNELTASKLPNRASGRGNPEVAGQIHDIDDDIDDNDDDNDGDGDGDDDNDDGGDDENKIINESRWI